MRRFPLICLTALALALTAGCGRDPDKAIVSLRVRGTADLAKAIADDPKSPWKVWGLHAYQLNHIWSGTGATVKDGKLASYRAKITVWDDDEKDHDLALAEIYFHDPDRFQPAGLHRNPDPNDPKDPNNQNAQGKGPGRTFRLHFPGSTLGVILSALRNSNEPVYLYYYENQWSVGVSNAEAVGVD